MNKLSMLGKKRYIDVNFGHDLPLRAHNCSVRSMSEAGGVGSGRPLHATDEQVAYLNQNCWSLACNVYINFTITCTATENKLWKAVTVAAKLLYDVHTMQSCVNVFSIVGRTAKS